MTLIALNSWHYFGAFLGNQLQGTMNFFTKRIMFLFVFVASFNVKAQTKLPEILIQAQQAIQNSDPKGLVAFFNEKVDLNFDGEIKAYSQTQAEFVLKDFFKKYPVVKFEYDHTNKSPEGLLYGIGKYTYNGGAFLVYIMVKDFNGKQIIDTLNFHEEDE